MVAAKDKDREQRIYLYRVATENLLSIKTEASVRTYKRFWSAVNYLRQKKYRIPVLCTALERYR